MFLRNVFICVYLVAVYWLSHHFAPAKMAFYPTLGAFCFLFMKKGGPLPHMARIILGACASAVIGSLLHYVDAGAVSFLITTALTLTLIQVSRLDAAPIMAVSIIPYFVHPTAVWILPAAVLVSLSGLLVPIWLLDRLEKSGWAASLEAAVLRTLKAKAGLKG
ncbi:hypothetical protein [Gorillibacterium sp. sgz5001074]|uniref:hypothetical protein n=1 Tax=Gorillibacterium sp. sgz5001074 TaxID=3446695 RepID=UPI003F67682D